MSETKTSCYKKNVIGISTVEFFWGLGFPIIMESTFLQLFLKHLGASDFIIGLVPSVFVIGTSFFPIFSSYLTRNHMYKRTIVILLHLISACSILIFGLILLFNNDTTTLLPLFFISYAVFSICIGLTIPVWLNYLMKLFEEDKIVSGLSYMMFAQNIAKIISSYFVLEMVEKYSFSLNSSAWIFIIAGILFVFGSLFFVITREFPDKTDHSLLNESFFSHTFKNMREILKNRNFLYFLIGDLDFYVILTILSFYANYATTYYNIPPAIAAGVFAGCIYIGSMTSNFLLGILNYLTLKQKFILSKFTTILLLFVLILFPGQTSFFMISFLLGFGRGTRSIVYSPCVKKFSGKEDATGYFALAPILTLPFSSSFPLIFGKVLDHFSHLNENAYKLMFAVSIAVFGITLIFGFLTNFNKKTLISQDSLSGPDK